MRIIRIQRLRDLLGCRSGGSSKYLHTDKSNYRDNGYGNDHSNDGVDRLLHNRSLPLGIRNARISDIEFQVRGIYVHPPRSGIKGEIVTSEWSVRVPQNGGCL